MKQIVFLIGALVVLLQLHSTTATADSQTGWDKIEAKIQANIESIKVWVNHLEESEESVWEDASVTEPAAWPEGATALIKQLDKESRELSKFIGKLRNTSSVELEDVKRDIDEIEARISLNFNEIGAKIENAATGTEQEVEDSVNDGIEELKNLIKTETTNTKHILNKAAKKRLKAEQTADGK